MSKKTYKDFDKWILKAIKYYKPILGLELNDIDVKKKDSCNYLEVSCTYPYIDTTIHYSENAFNKWINGKLKKDRILHELCHLITDPLYSKAISRFIAKQDIEDERERLTDIISAIIRKLDK